MLSTWKAAHNDALSPDNLLLLLHAHPNDIPCRETIHCILCQAHALQYKADFNFVTHANLFSQKTYEATDSSLTCLCLEVIGCYVDWVDINLIANNKFVRYDKFVGYGASQIVWYSHKHCSMIIDFPKTLPQE